jgi:carboxyl-terminal processing protease
MTSSARTAWSALFVLAVIGAAALGSVVRVSLEVGAAPAGLPGGTGALVASRDGKLEIEERDYFFNLADHVRRTFIDPIQDEQKLAVGAVKGMVASLEDSHSHFMDPEEMQLHEAMIRGEFYGIGVELKYLFDPDAQERRERDPENVDISLFVPELVVAAVAPGSPAARAGLRAGDRVTGVAGRWVLSPTAIREFRALSQQIQRGQIDPDRIEEVRRRLRDQARNGMAPARARGELTEGASGHVEVGWRRGDRTFQARIAKARTVVPAVLEREGAYEVRIFTGAAQQLAGALRGRTAATLDLRNSTIGDYGELPKLLAVLAPAGEYGKLVDERGRPPRPLRVAEGADAPPELTLIVDSSTRGAAEVLALALSSRGRATLRGSEMAGERVFLETFRLQDGSGYTIPTARFQARLAAGGAR